MERTWNILDLFTNIQLLDLHNFLNDWLVSFEWTGHFFTYFTSLKFCRICGYDHPVNLVTPQQPQGAAALSWRGFYRGSWQKSIQHKKNLQSKAFTHLGAANVKKLKYIGYFNLCFLKSTIRNELILLYYYNQYQCLCRRNQIQF